MVRIYLKLATGNGRISRDFICLISGGIFMHKQVFDTSDNLDIQKDKNAQNVVRKIIGTFLMFAACLMVCHSLGLIHIAIGHFSL